MSEYSKGNKKVFGKQANQSIKGEKIDRGTPAKTVIAGRDLRTGNTKK